jgi:transcriptional regulator with XRE-family HTH domain
MRANFNETEELGMENTMKNTSDIRAEQAAAVRTFGARMKQARELCNMSQLTAAQRLGYANSSKLSKVEIATDGNSVPTWLIVRASRVYEVSTDYLLGQTDEWEIGMRIPIEGEASEWLFKAFRKTSQREMLVLLELHKKRYVSSQLSPHSFSRSSNPARKGWPQPPQRR